MGWQFWMKRAITVFIAVAVLLFAVEWLKGSTLLDAAYFALFWSAVSSGIFIATRLYHASRNRHCALCKDTPEMADNEHGQP